MECVTVIYPEFAHLRDVESITALHDGRYSCEDQAGQVTPPNKGISPSPISTPSDPQEPKAWKNPNRKPTPIPDLMSHIAKLHVNEARGNDRCEDHDEPDIDSEGFLHPGFEQ